MSILNAKEVRALMHENDARLGKGALVALEHEVTRIIKASISVARPQTTVNGTDVAGWRHAPWRGDL